MIELTREGYQAVVAFWDVNSWMKLLALTIKMRSVSAVGLGEGSYGAFSLSLACADSAIHGR